ncbi:MAG: putative glycosyltransferase (TIGR04348 family) [Candidatus Latescibacterota bacterium]|jgi:putative glycosyltransferase (TIGR04348 family)
MKITLITPAPAGSRKGNRVTAHRWARILRTLGHRVDIRVEHSSSSRSDLLLALHARRSFPAIEQFHRQHPDRPLVLALTGTDLYGDIHTDPQAQQSLEMASHLILLQPDGLKQLPKHLHKKTRVIYQSFTCPPGPVTPRKRVYEVCVLGHLRDVKDSFRTAEAVRHLPPESRIEVVHLGAALDADMEARARGETAVNLRYRWLGEHPRWKAIRILARSRLLVLTSRMEGGANVVSEALACSVPVLSSRISGSIGLLGEDYPGYFPVGDTRALAEQLWRAETDANFYADLKSRCQDRAAIVDPAGEQASWRHLLDEL